MLDYFAIFTKGGALLWTLQFTTALKHNPVDALNVLIRSCLLEERSADNGFTFTPRAGAAQTLKWTFHNGLGLVFVAVYQKTLSLLYVDELLARVRDAFAVHYKPGCYDYSSFTPEFGPIARDCEARAEAARKPLAAKSTNQLGSAKGATGGANNGGKKGAKGGKEGQQEGDDEDSDAAAAATAAAASAANSSGDEGGAATANGSGAESGDGAGGVGGGFDMSRISKLGVGKRDGRRGASRRTTKDGDDSKAKEASPDKKGKKARSWGGGTKDTSNTKLDYSTTGPAPNGTAIGGAAAGGFEGGVSRMEEADDEEYSDDESEVEEAVALAKGGQAGAANGAPAKRGILGSFVSGLAMRVVGKAALEKADLEPVLEDMRRKLMERNVAEEVAGQVVQNLARSLEGQKLSSFTGISSFVKAEFEKVLSSILNKRQVDVLHDIQRTNARGKPYVIVFCGVNGVGKSTNLAKIAYWLGSHGVKVQLAACDTFRAGAVEQLKTHAVRLGVPLYERGYEKDPAKVAAEAIRVAERDGRNVVLVDTAGRMQDNEPLMRALANLIHVNTPNLVLFVGEALVGNDAVDQLVKFGRSLEEQAPSSGPKRERYIDGIVLTKFDTVDEKVGAAVSMVYKSGAPVMFVGCGQTYLDLKRLNVRSVVKSLLS